MRLCKDRQNRLALRVISSSLCLGLLIICGAKSVALVAPDLLGAQMVMQAATPSGTLDYIGTDTDLPSGSVETGLIPMAISLILGIFSVLLTGVAIYSGVLFVAHFGNEEKVTQARDMLIWAVVGVVVTALSYAIISGVLNLDWD